MPHPLRSTSRRSSRGRPCTRSQTRGRHCNGATAASECADMPDEARAFWVTAPGRGEIRGEALRPPAEGEVVITALYSGISRGTEALVFAGRVPPSEWDRMRAPFQQGNFPAPVKYGYSMVGRV